MTLSCLYGASLFLALFTTPAYIRYFNDNAALGLWFTLLSVLAWVLNFDLGIGSGLRNKLTGALVHNNLDEAKRYISAAYIAIGVLVLVFIFVANFVFQFVDWNYVFNVQINVVSEETLLTSVRIVFSRVMIQFVLRLVSSILYAMQMSSLNNFLGLISTFISFIYVSFAPSGTSDSNMIQMAIVHVLAVNLPLLLATIGLFTTKLRGLFPQHKFFRIEYAKAVLSLGGTFFFVQIVYMLIVNTNEYLITLFSGSQYVVEYQIYYKLFSLVGTIFSLAMSPIWSAVTKALAERKFTWVKGLYKKLLLLACAGTVCIFSALAVLQVGINIWLGENAIVVDYGIAVWFAILGSLMIFNGVLSSISNGAGELKTQAIFFGIGAVVKVPLAYLLVHLMGSWVGIIVANDIALGIYIAVQPWWLRKYLRRMEEG